MSESGDELDPRILRSRRVIQEAAIAEMAAVGYGAMTVEAVARRAGVSKATLYRQWSGKLDLVASALAMLKDELVLDDASPPRDRLRVLLTWLASHLADTEDPIAVCVPVLVGAAQYDDALREFHHRFNSERRAVLVELLREGQHLGDIPAELDVERTADLLVGPLFYRRLMSATPFDPADVPELIETVLRPTVPRRDTGR